MVQVPIVQAIGYGVRAPNPHNTQAWKFRLLSDTEALLYIDERRLLVHTDPDARQIHLGAGCCLETLSIGMSAHGYTTAIELLPEGAHAFSEIGKKPVARIVLRADSAVARDDLYDQIDRRQTNRRPYTGPFVSAHEAEQISGLVPSGDLELQVLHDVEQMRPLFEIFDRAWQLEATNRRVFDESRIWFRFNERQRRTRRDGLSVPQLGFDGMEARVMEWSLLRGLPAVWFSELSVRASVASTQRGIESARGLVLLKSRDNDQKTWLEAGRAFARVHLGLTQLGLTCHPYSQVLQEYPEMAELQAEFNQRLAIHAPARMQMMARVGRADRTYPAPRRAPEDFIQHS